MAVFTRQLLCPGQGVVPGLPSPLHTGDGPSLVPPAHRPSGLEHAVERPELGQPQRLSSPHIPRPIRLQGGRQRATLGCPKGIFGGCAPEVPALKCHLYYLILRGRGPSSSSISFWRETGWPRPQGSSLMLEQGQHVKSYSDPGFPRMPFHGTRRQERLDLTWSPIFRMAFVVEHDVSAHPVDLGAFGTHRVVLHPHDVPSPIAPCLLGR